MTTSLLPVVDRRRVTSIAEARAALDWPPDRYVVVHADAMGPEQDLATLVEAARYLPDGIDVLLTGDGSERPALQEDSFGLTNLCFVDPMDDARHALALAAADLLAVTEHAAARHLRPSSALTAYLTAGRPILAAVARDGATAAALSRTGRTRLVVRPGDAELLAEAIVGLRDGLF